MSQNGGRRRAERIARLSRSANILHTALGALLIFGHDIHVHIYFGEILRLTLVLAFSTMKQLPSSQITTRNHHLPSESTTSYRNGYSSTCQKEPKKKKKKGEIKT